MGGRGIPTRTWRSEGTAPHLQWNRRRQPNPWVQIPFTATKASSSSPQAEADRPAGIEPTSTSAISARSDHGGDYPADAEDARYAVRRSEEPGVQPIRLDKSAHDYTADRWSAMTLTAPSDTTRDREAALSTTPGARTGLSPDKNAGAPASTYADAHRARLGVTLQAGFPVNRPKSEVHKPSQDGALRVNNISTRCSPELLRRPKGRQERGRRGALVHRRRHGCVRITPAPLTTTTGVRRHRWFAGDGRGGARAPGSNVGWGTCARVSNRGGWMRVRYGEHDKEVGDKI